ncbi:hypothetical protein B0H19DRAFT_1339701 [Mycena capillaripes]|nr:hypothetical protein B0H19DRAFT_1339701 [Mycena capillaripes]
MTERTSPHPGHSQHPRWPSQILPVQLVPGRVHDPVTVIEKVALWQVEEFRREGRVPSLTDAQQIWGYFTYLYSAIETRLATRTIRSVLDTFKAELARASSPRLEQYERIITLARTLERGGFQPDPYHLVPRQFRDDMYSPGYQEWLLSRTAGIRLSNSSRAYGNTQTAYENEVASHVRLSNDKGALSRGGLAGTATLRAKRAEREQHRGLLRHRKHLTSIYYPPSQSLPRICRRSIFKGEHSYNNSDAGTGASAASLFASTNAHNTIPYSDSFPQIEPSATTDTRPMYYQQGPPTDEGMVDDVGSTDHISARAYEDDE